MTEEKGRKPLLSGGGFRKDDARNPLNYACPACRAKRFKPCSRRSTCQARHARAFEKGGPW